MLAKLVVVFCAVISPAFLGANACALRLMGDNRTRNLIQLSPPSGVTCSNPDPIPDLAECFGSCESYLTFNQNTLTVDKERCDCCKSTEMATATVKLECSDGGSIEHVLKYPKSCKCGNCRSSSKSFTEEQV